MADNTRHNAIISCRAAEGRGRLALHLAVHTELTVEQSIDVLLAAPKGDVDEDQVPGRVVAAAPENLLVATRSVAGSAAILPEPPAGEARLLTATRMIAGGAAILPESPADEPALLAATRMVAGAAAMQGAEEVVAADMDDETGLMAAAAMIAGKVGPK